MAVINYVTKSGKSGTFDTSVIKTPQDKQAALDYISANLKPFKVLRRDGKYESFDPKTMVIGDIDWIHNHSIEGSKLLSKPVDYAKERYYEATKTPATKAAKQLKAGATEAGAKVLGGAASLLLKASGGMPVGQYSKQTAKQMLETPMYVKKAITESGKKKAEKVYAETGGRGFYSGLGEFAVDLPMYIAGDAAAVKLLGKALKTTPAIKTGLEKVIVNGGKATDIIRYLSKYPQAKEITKYLVKQAGSGAARGGTSGAVYGTLKGEDVKGVAGEAATFALFGAASDVLKPMFKSQAAMTMWDNTISKQAQRVIKEFKAAGSQFSDAEIIQGFRLLRAPAGRATSLNKYFKDLAIEKGTTITESQNKALNAFVKGIDEWLKESAQRKALPGATATDEAIMAKLESRIKQHKGMTIEELEKQIPFLEKKLSAAKKGKVDAVSTRTQMELDSVKRNISEKKKFAKKQRYTDIEAAKAHAAEQQRIAAEEALQAETRAAQTKAQMEAQRKALPGYQEALEAEAEIATPAKPLTKTTKRKPFELGEAPETSYEKALAREYGEMGTYGSLYQEAEKTLTPRGSIVSRNGKSAIRLFEDADLSTVAHEGFHYYLTRKAPKKFVDMLENEIPGLNARYGSPEFIEAQEQAARLFEKYLSDGIAPNARLAPVFADMKNTMARIYKDVEQSPLNETITPQVRRIFNKMLSGKKPITGKTPIEIARMKQLMNQRELDARQPNLYEQPGIKRSWGYEPSATRMMETAKEVGKEKYDVVAQDIDDMIKGKDLGGVMTSLFSEQTPIRKAAGEELYIRAVNDLGSAGTAQTMLMGELKGWGKGIADKVVEKDGKKQALSAIISDYITWLRAKEVDAKMKEQGVTDAIPDSLRISGPELEAWVNASPYKDVIVKKAKDLSGIARKMLDYMRDNDYIDDATYKAIVASSQNYVPIYRKFTEAEIKRLREEGNYYAANSLKRLVGSERDVISALENIATMYIKTVTEVNSNNIRRDVVKAVLANPEYKHLIKEVKAVPERGMKIDSDGLAEFFVDSSLKPNQIFIRDNGVKKIYEISDKYLLDALKKPAMNQGGITLRTLETMKELKRFGITSAPSFTFWKNPIRDFMAFTMNDPMAGMVLPKGASPIILKAIAPFAAVPDSLYWYFKAVPEVFKKMTDPGNRETIAYYLNEKGALNSTLYILRENIVKDLMKYTAPMRVKAGAVRPKDAVAAWESLGMFFESLPRMAAAMRTLQRKYGLKSIDEIKSNPKALEEAVYVYRTITADFAQKGRSTKELGRVIPFLTASFAGAKSELEALKKDPALYIAKGITLLGIPMYLNWLRVRDEDWYKNMDPKMRSNYIHLTPEIRLPVSYGGMAGLVKATEEILNGIYDSREGWASRAAEIAVERGVPITGFSQLLPSLAAIPIVLGRNKDLYYKTPIEPEATKQLPKTMRYKETTSPVAKAISSMLDEMRKSYNAGNGTKAWKDIGADYGLSPAQIDFIIKELGGTMAVVGSETASKAITPGWQRQGGDRKLKTIIMGRDAKFNPYNAEVNKFYDNYQESKMAYMAAKRLYDRGTPYEEIPNEYIAPAQAYEKLNQVNGDLSDAWKYYREYNDRNQHKDWSDEYREEMLLRVIEYISENTQETNKYYEEMNAR